MKVDFLNSHLSYWLHPILQSILFKFDLHKFSLKFCKAFNRFNMKFIRLTIGILNIIIIIQYKIMQIKTINSFHDNKGQQIIQ